MMESIYQLLKAALLPPFSPILLGLAGLAVLHRTPKVGRALIAAGLISLYALSTVAVGESLLAKVESPPLAAGASADAAQAIVVLGAGLYADAPELGGDDVRGEALERLRYAAVLHRATGRPILLSGGRPHGARTAEAEAMAKALARDFGIAARWVEDASDNTRTNAFRSAAVLRESGVSRIYLVTHAWHMARARVAFEAAGLAVVPAPTIFATSRAWTAVDFVPKDEGLALSRRAIQEWLGRLTEIR